MPWHLIPLKALFKYHLLSEVYNVYPIQNRSLLFLFSSLSPIPLNFYSPSHSGRYRFLTYCLFLRYPFPTEMRFHLGRDLCLFYDVSQASLVAQMVKNLPLVWETQVWFLGWEDPLEKRMATHSSMLAGEFHGQRILAVYSPWGHKELWCSWVTKHSPAAIDYHFNFFRHIEHCLVQIRYLIHIYWMNKYMNMHCARL